LSYIGKLNITFDGTAARKVGPPGAGPFGAPIGCPRANTWFARAREFVTGGAKSGLNPRVQRLL
jgi:hypothetical protein